MATTPENGWYPGLRESATFDRDTIAEIQRAAREGMYDIRGFGAKRRVPHFDDLLFLGRERLALSARGLPRAAATPTSCSGRATAGSHSSSASRKRVRAWKARGFASSSTKRRSIASAPISPIASRA